MSIILDPRVSTYDKRGIAGSLVFIEFDCKPLLYMHQSNDAYDQFYLMGDDEDETNDLWDEYYNKTINPGKDSIVKAEKNDKEKYPHKCIHCGAPSYNNIFNGSTDCSSCDGTGKCKCGGKGGCKDCKCDTGKCGNKQGGCGGCSH